MAPAVGAVALMTCEDPPDDRACPLCSQPLDSTEILDAARWLLHEFDTGSARRTHAAVEALRLLLPPLPPRPLPEVPRVDA